MYYKCLLCKKALKPNQVIKLEKLIDNKYRVILPYHFCKECYKIYEERLNDYLLR